MADKEGGRKSPMELVVCTTPDVCKTPMGPATPPVPYPVVGMMSQAVGTASTVELTGMQAFTKASKIPTVIGDEPGVATGIKSGTVKGTAEPQASSSTVSAEGNLVCRHDDLFGMNNDNTKGKLVCMEVGPGGGGAGESGKGSPEFDEQGQCKADTNPPVQAETPAEGAKLQEMTDQAAQTPSGQSWWSKWKDSIHTGLDVAGMVPVVGEAADGANALIYLAEGDVLNAGISGAALIPIGGQAATGGRLGYKGGKAVAKELGQEAIQKTGQEAAQQATKELEQDTLGQVEREAAAKTHEAAKSGGAGGGSGGGGGDGLKIVRLPQGGSYKELRRAHKGTGKQAHHMPAKSASSLPEQDGPAIIMEADDHALTASFDQRAGSKEYRAMQQGLAGKGRFREAMEMDIADIQAKFGDKYDGAIGQAIDYAKSIGKW